MKCNLLLLSAAALFCCAAPAWGGNLDLNLPYQKTLTAAPPVTGPAVSVTFSLYDSATGGTLVWRESRNMNLAATTRLLNVKLGEGATKLDLTAFANQQLWVEVQIGSTTVGTRDKFSPAPYALWSASAAVADSSITGAKLAQMGATDGQALAWNGTSWAPASIGGGTPVTSVSATAPLASTGGATPTISLSGTVAVAHGGTGSTTRNFVDLTSNETIGGYKTFQYPITANVIGSVQTAMGLRDTLNNSYAAGGVVYQDSSNATKSSVGSAGQILVSDGTNGVKWQSLPVAGWNVVSGTTQTAVANNGYLATNAALTTITLPAAPAVGDVVKLSGLGAGGWQVNTNTGQAFNTVIQSAGITWTARDAARGWISVASSSDGSKLVAVEIGGAIYTSTDSGVSWTPRGSNGNWISVASSSDGSKLVAAQYPGPIYTSTDSGLTWTSRNNTNAWVAVASSSDGSKLVAVTSGGQIYTSTDSGVTWTARDSDRYWRSIASSSDGSKLVATENFIGGGQIYTSTDSGVTWTARGNTQNWVSIASSSDGSKLVAVANGGQIYTSTDSGVTWTARGTTQNWVSIASSSDGSKLVAVTSGGQIYTSTDSGVTWTARATNRSWQAVASSSDGSKLVAVVSSGQIYTSIPVSEVTTTATTLGGAAYSSIELVYIGSNQWVITSKTVL